MLPVKSGARAEALGGQSRPRRPRSPNERSSSATRVWASRTRGSSLRRSCAMATRCLRVSMSRSAMHSNNSANRSGLCSRSGIVLSGIHVASVIARSRSGGVRYAATPVVPSHASAPIGDRMPILRLAMLPKTAAPKRTSASAKRPSARHREQSTSASSPPFKASQYLLQSAHETSRRRAGSPCRHKDGVKCPWDLERRRQDKVASDRHDPRQGSPSKT